MRRRRDMLALVAPALLLSAGCAKQVNLSVSLVTQGCAAGDAGASVAPTTGVVTLRFLVINTPIGRSLRCFQSNVYG